MIPKGWKASRGLDGRAPAGCELILRRDTETLDSRVLKIITEDGIESQSDKCPNSHIFLPEGKKLPQGWICSSWMDEDTKDRNVHKEENHSGGMKAIIVEGNVPEGWMDIWKKDLFQGVGFIPNEWKSSRGLQIIKEGKVHSGWRRFSRRDRSIKMWKISLGWQQMGWLELHSNVPRKGYG